MVQSARDVDRIVVVDGCDVCCARKLLEHLEIRPHQHVVVTQLGIEKSYDVTWPAEQVVAVTEAVRGPAAAKASVSSSGQKGTCCT